MSLPLPPDGEWDEVRIAAVLRSGWRRAQATMTRALAMSDLSGLEYHLLLVVSTTGETGIRQVDLAQELGVAEGKVSVLARELGGRGLIEAVRSEPDRRYVRLRIRPAGQRLLRVAMRCQREELVAMVGQLPEDTVVLPMIEFICRTYLGLDVTVGRRC
ncbi:MAG TPA: MarR family winged helix-turn-helix transcriptional regulator [Candidatus Dormibacteraeota bacterium]|nr:MarR family winged helix-turn-helix transcriptional regulator [Candidatus Dormibacteraeota bacterium]